MHYPGDGLYARPISILKNMDRKDFTACRSIKEALEIITNELQRSGKRDQLTRRIGEPMYDKLCALGYITQGVTVDFSEQGSLKRVRVWQLTDKPDLFKRISEAPTEEECSIGEALANMMAFQA